MEQFTLALALMHGMVVPSVPPGTRGTSRADLESIRAPGNSDSTTQLRTRGTWAQLSHRNVYSRDRSRVYGNCSTTTARFLRVAVTILLQAHDRLRRWGANEDGGSRWDREGGVGTNECESEGAHHKGVGYKGKLPVSLACREKWVRRVR